MLPRVRTAVAYFITHTGQINYLRFALCSVKTYATLLISVVHLGTSLNYPVVAVSGTGTDVSARQKACVGRRSGGPPKSSPLYKEITRPIQRGVNPKWSHSKVAGILVGAV